MYATVFVALTEVREETARHLRRQAKEGASTTGRQMNAARRTALVNTFRAFVLGHTRYLYRRRRAEL